MGFFQLPSIFEHGRAWARPQAPLDLLTDVGCQPDSRWTRMSAAARSDSAIPADIIQLSFDPTIFVASLGLDTTGTGFMTGSAATVFTCWRRLLKLTQQNLHGHQP